MARWLRLDEGPAWPFQVRSGTGELRRNVSYRGPQSGRASGLILLQLIDITGWQHELAGKEERPSSRTEAGR